MKGAIQETNRDRLYVELDPTLSARGWYRELIFFYKSAPPFFGLPNNLINFNSERNHSTRSVSRRQFKKEVQTSTKSVTVLKMELTV